MAIAVSRNLSAVNASHPLIYLYLHRYMCVYSGCNNDVQDFMLNKSLCVNFSVATLIYGNKQKDYH